MATPSFYCPELTDESVDLKDFLITLSESESGHAARSRRLRAGQTVNLLNGRGVVAKGAIDEVNKRAVTIKVSSCVYTKIAQRPLTIATAIPKGDRQKVMVDMLSQLGVSKIIPLETEHSVTRCSKNLGEKWQRTAIEACKQSQNPWLPIITECMTINQLLELQGYDIAYADGQGQSINSIVAGSSNPLLVIIGPEGGLSGNEITFLDGNNVMKLILGANILRTEAAAVAVAAQFSN